MSRNSLRTGLCDLSGATCHRSITGPAHNLWGFAVCVCVCVRVCLCARARVRAQSLQSCPTLCDPMDCSPPCRSVHGIFPSKNTRMGCRSLLQGIFQTQGSNVRFLCLLHWQASSLPLASPGKLFSTNTVMASKGFPLMYR